MGKKSRLKRERRNVAANALQLTPFGISALMRIKQRQTELDREMSFEEIGELLEIGAAEAEVFVRTALSTYQANELNLQNENFKSRDSVRRMLRDPNSGAVACGSDGVTP